MSLDAVANHRAPKPHEILMFASKKMPHHALTLRSSIVLIVVVEARESQAFEVFFQEVAKLRLDITKLDCTSYSTE